MAKLQVTSNPKQKDGVNCGLWTGLAAEVFCTNALGRFRMETVNSESVVTCEGENPDFLMKKTSWADAQDVVLARLYGQAAALAYWRWEFPGECPRLESLWPAVLARLRAAMPTVMSQGLALWCALPCVCHPYRNR